MQFCLNVFKLRGRSGAAGSGGPGNHHPSGKNLGHTQTGLAMQGIAIPDEMAIRKTKDSWLLQVMLELLLCFMWDFRLY